MKLFIVILMSASAWAQIQQPLIGVMLDEGGGSRPVIGTPAAAILGDSIFKEAAISLACSVGLCLAKTESALISSTGDSWDAPPGAALIAFDGDAAYVYFVETRQLVYWSQGRLDAVDFTPDGDALSLRASPHGFEYAVGRDDGIWVGDRNLGAANTILLLDGGRAPLAADGQVRLIEADGTELDFAVAGAESFIGGFVRMSARYVEVITSGGMWVLDLEPGHEQIYLLPGVSQ